MFTLFVSSASVAVEEKEVITAGRVGLQCSIRFSPDWDGLVKTAVFDGAESRDVIVTGERVTIPAECLAAAGDCLKAGFYGKSTDGAVVIPTVWASLGMIEHSVYPSGREGADPTPDVVAQIQQAAANAEKMARSVREDADLGRLAGPAGSKGEKGDKGDKGDKGEKGADGKSAYAYAVEGGYTGTEAEFAAKLAAEKLANPNALTFTGAVDAVYDGSAPVSVDIPQGGGGSSGGYVDTIIADIEITEEVSTYRTSTLTSDQVEALKNADIIYFCANLEKPSDQTTRGTLLASIYGSYYHPTKFFYNDSAYTNVTPSSSAYGGDIAESISVKNEASGKYFQRIKWKSTDNQYGGESEKSVRTSIVIPGGSVFNLSTSTVFGVGTTAKLIARRFL